MIKQYIEEFGSGNAGKAILAAAMSSAITLAASPTMADETFVLEEIIVTAQKRAESVQDVPIAISAMSVEFVENVGAQSTGDIGMFTPGLETRNDTVTRPKYNIRGIVTNDFGIGADPAVAVYVDGVYSGRSAASMTVFLDLERVEVLKGPQGTLFGKNAAAGAIHLITKKPGAEFETSVGVSVGSYAKQKIDVMVNLPLTDDLFLRVNAMTNERDGYRKNIFTGKDVANENNGGARASLLWLASESTEVLFRAEYADLDQDAPINISLLGDVDLYGDANVNDLEAGETLELWGGSMTIESDLDSVIFTSITSGKSFEASNRQDEDGTSEITTSFSTQTTEENKFFSQEFRLVSNTDGNLRWTLGAMYSREHGKQTTTLDFGMETLDKFFLTDTFDWAFDIWNGFTGNAFTPATAPTGLGWDIALDLGDNAFPDNIAVWGTPAAGGQGLISLLPRLVEQADGELKSYSYAVYADMTYSLTDQINLTTGVRYTLDEKDYSMSVPANAINFSIALPFVVPTSEQSEEWENVSYRVVLDYIFSDDAMAYVSYATGYKAGGFNSTTVSDPFDQEEVTNLELGLKSTWMDGRLRVNGSVFRYEYDGLQEIAQIFVDDNIFSTFVVRSIDSEAVGAELEVNWLVTANLLLGANYSYVDSEITDFPLFAGELETESRKGIPQSSVAKNSYSLNAEYTLHLESMGELDFRLDYSYVGKRVNQDFAQASAPTQALLDQYEGELTDGYKDVSARMTFRDADGHWRVALYAQNLTDEEYLYALGGPSSNINAPSASRGRPRLYGLEVNYTY